MYLVISSTETLSTSEMVSRGPRTGGAGWPMPSAMTMIVAVGTPLKSASMVTIGMMIAPKHKDIGGAVDEQASEDQDDQDHHDHQRDAVADGQHEAHHVHRDVPRRHDVGEHILARPRFLFADEPTSRLDPITRRDVIRLIEGVATEKGVALALVSHDPALIASIADTVCDLGDPLGRDAQPDQAATATPQALDNHYRGLAGPAPS
jgi:ABC-type hemin transport system ATPase subunit